MTNAAKTAAFEDVVSGAEWLFSPLMFQNASFATPARSRLFCKAITLKRGD